jgi:hypothetical protein
VSSVVHSFIWEPPHSSPPLASSEGCPLALAQSHLTCTSHSQSSRVCYWQLSIPHIHCSVQPDTLQRDVRTFLIILFTCCRSWRSDILNFHFAPFNILIANVCISLQKGDDALAGQEEINISHYFPPTTSDRTISFKGYYLSIYNKQTSHYATHIDNQIPTTEYEKYSVPTGYTVYVRGATVKFE